MRRDRLQGIFDRITLIDTRFEILKRDAEIVATALAEGMRTLKQDGIEKVLQGVTDMLQVRAVCIK